MGEYYMVVGSGISDLGGSSEAAAAKAKVFFEQWEEDKGQALGNC